MPRPVRRRLVLTAMAACVVLAGPVAVAQASDTKIIGTLNVYGPKIKHDELAIQAGINAYRKGKVRPLIRALNHEVGDLHALNKKLKHERASSGRGRKAKKDLVRGFGLIAAAYTALRQDVQAAHGGSVPVAEVKAAQHTRNRGHAKVVAGLKLLGG